jgi:hypothetical protein
MDELVIFGAISERIDTLLGQFYPGTRLKFCAYLINHFFFWDDGYSHSTVPPVAIK